MKRKRAIKFLYKWQVRWVNLGGKIYPDFIYHGKIFHFKMFLAVDYGARRWANIREYSKLIPFPLGRG